MVLFFSILLIVIILLEFPILREICIVLLICCVFYATYLVGVEYNKIQDTKTQNYRRQKMYIYTYDTKAQTMNLTSGNSYPKETVILQEDAITGLLVPSHVHVMKFKPVSGRKIEIEVAENGYVLKQAKRIKVVPESSWGNDDLNREMNLFLNEEVESERDLTENELEDEDFIETLEKMNGEFSNQESD